MMNTKLQPQARAAIVDPVAADPTAAASMPEAMRKVRVKHVRMTQGHSEPSDPAAETVPDEHMLSQDAIPLAETEGTADGELRQPLEDGNDASCRKDRQTDGREEDQRDDCDAVAVFPWPIAAMGGLAATAIAFGGRSSHHDTAPTVPSAGAGIDLPVVPVAPAVPAVPEAPSTPITPTTPSSHDQPSLEPASLAAPPHLTTSSGKPTIDPTGHVAVALESPGSRWVFRVDGDSTWHEGQGDRIPADAIKSGIHAVMVAQLDDEGRVGHVATLAVRVHHDMPAVVLALAEDTGSSDTDGVTHNGTIMVSGLETNATWFYRVNGAGDWVQGVGSEIPGSALSEGANKVEVYQIGDDPDTFTIRSLDLNLDLTAPDAPSLTSSSNSLLLNASGSINLSHLEAGAKWEWREDGGDWQEGVGSVLSATVLHQGSHTVDVRQTDSAGNVSAVNSMDIDVDLSTPVALSASVLKNNGTAAADHLINASGYVSIGAMEPNAHWEFKVGNDGHWRAGNENGILSSRYFDEGANVLQVRQVNAAGNPGVETLIDLTLDTAPPVITVSAKNPFYFSNEASVMHLNQYSSFSVFNSGNTSAKVQFAGQTYDFAADSNGTWSAGFLHQGGNTLQITSTDKAGNVASRTFRIEYDGTPPTTPTVALKNDTGASSTDQVTADATVTVSGLGWGDQFRHSEDNGVTWSNWMEGNEIAATAFGSDGVKTVLVQSMDNFGNLGGQASLSFTLDSSVI
jgi:hypothetical protein